MTRPQVHVGTFVDGRLVLRIPLTARQEKIARLLSDGMELDEIAAYLKCGRSAIDYHIAEACRRIPGDLPRSARLVAWWRGADFEVLEQPPGAALRRSMAQAATILRKKTD